MPIVTHGDTGRLLGVKLKRVTVAELPAASAQNVGRIIYVSNGAAGSPTVAVSNGTNWIRLDNLATVAAS